MLTPSPNGADGHTLATASSDQTVLLWDLTDPARPRRLGDPLAGHTDAVSAVVFAPDGHTLATASADQTVLLWDVGDPARPRRLGEPLIGHTDAVSAVVFAPDGRTLATAGDDETVLLWDVADPGRPRRLGDPLTGPEQAATRGATVTIVIDFVHVLEKLWKAAWTLFYPGDRDAEAWVADRARTVLTGRAVDAAATIRYQVDEAGFRGRERAGADEAAAYLTRKSPYLDYATALANGWQIATGIIEGAARFLIKDRMDITGARWSTPGAEAVLRLRAVIANGDFDEYWQYHQQQELRRNHLDRYQELNLAA